MTTGTSDRSGSGDDYDRAACGLLTTAADGTIEAVNATFSIWIGLPAAELLGRRFQSLLTMGSRLFHQTHWSPLLEMQGSVAEVQLELCHSSGRVLPILVNAAKRPSEAGARSRVDVAVFIATDRRKYERELLVARKRAEELLELTRAAESARALAEARLRLALDSANLRVWSADLPEGKRRYEPQVAALIGRPGLEEVTAEVFASHMHPDDRARDQAAFAAALDPTQRVTYSLEYPLLGADRVERVVRSTGHAFFDEQGQAVQFSGVLEDITDRRRSEEELRRRETAFRTLAENSPDMIARFDGNRRIAFMSPAVERMRGEPPASFLGRTVNEFGLDEGNAGAWNAALDDAFAGREASLTLSYRAPDGSKSELQSHIVPEWNARGEVVSVIAISRDVTLLRHQEVEARQRALLAEQLIGIVSHDLRNPLNAVAMGAHILGTLDLGPHSRTVRRIASSAERANRLTADLLDFTQARLGGGLRVEPRDIDLHAVVADCLEEVKAGSGSRMIEHRTIGEGSGMGDPDRLEQVVTNLVNNAIVYGTPDQPVVVTSVVADDRLEIRVHNAGAPIPEELKTQIFEPMRRGDPHVQRGSRSVGLGLYIVREIAAAHGGQVTVSSSSGAGTTFLVSLPRASTAR